MRFYAAMACALFACTPAHGVNLIVDGGFEGQPAGAGGYAHHAAGTSFDGGAWFVLGVDILTIDTAYSVGDAPPLVFAAHGGRTSLDLTGTGNSSPADGIFQDVATQAGQLYTLGFYVGRAMSSGSVGGDYPSTATVRLSIDGGPVIDFVNSDTILSGIAWKPFRYSFLATSGKTRVTFTNGTGNDYLGLDDVSLSAAPEPNVWLFSILGFGLIGARLRHTPRAPLIRGHNT